MSGTPDAKRSVRARTRRSKKDDSDREDSSREEASSTGPVDPALLDAHVQEARRLTSEEPGHVTPMLQKYFEFCQRYHTPPNPSVCVALNNPGLIKHLKVTIPLREEGMLAFGEILKLDKNITSLDLSNNLITSSGCYILQSVLKANNTLTALNLSYNDIGPHGGDALAHALKVNKTVTELNMRGNRLLAKGAVALAEGLADNDVMEYLDLSNNHIGVEGVRAIMSATQNKKIELNVDGSHVLEEILNSITHGIGVLLSLVGGYYLAKESENQSHEYYVSTMIFALSLFILYTSSTLAHSFFKMRITGHIFRVLDHSAIYVLIAGSYTPFMMVTLGHTWVGVNMVSVVWVLAIVGIGLSVNGDGKYATIRVVLTLSMGWMAVLGMPWIYECLSTQGLLLMFGGGLAYTVGVYFYITGLTEPMNHAIWHMFVLAGSIFHYFCILREVRPCVLP
eukprot:Colp12_sorted_trinity150504_noHs@23545